ncbi:MAG: molybdopterin-synthase adenylyltransferase MoeB [Gammaproteobacteria bacterium RBG_16_51_14]|nr:MAG: molybdopterin-synthase adenylyltransferase MoeB [Gammaproteobacteria bacterium RBG_16_51_14]
MNDDQLLRYSRQMMLPEIDAAGQERLADSRVLIIGLGGLGSSASIYLAAAGVGHLVLVDFDNVDLSNLQRQIVHGTGDIHRPKVDSARDHLLALNPCITVTTVNRKLEDAELDAEVLKADVVVDASDNFKTRFSINKACFKNLTPLVSAAAIRFEGQISVFNPGDVNSPCYHCLYHEEAIVDETCTANGVLAPLPGIIGSIQASETLKLLMNIGQTLQGKLLLFDILNMEWHQAILPKDPDCPVCGHGKQDP